MAEPAKLRDLKVRHQILIEDLAGQFRSVLDLSSDAMYVYLDDDHKICNQNAADIWGYSREEWNAVSPFLDNLIAEESRADVAENYNKCRSNLMSLSFKAKATRKDGSVFDAEIAMVPIVNFDDFFVLNLIRQTG